MMKELIEVKEIVECRSAAEANRHLDQGWILLKIFYQKQLCYKTVVVNKQERIQPFDRLVMMFVVGRIK